MSPPSRLKVGIVGYGEIARFHSRHLLAAGADVVGVVTRRPDTGLTVYPSLASMLPHVDAITIAVPNHLHASLCAEAVVAGKAVLVEKPLCLTTAECRMLEALLPSASVPRPRRIPASLESAPARATAPRASAPSRTVPFTVSALIGSLLARTGPGGWPRAAGRFWDRRSQPGSRPVAGTRTR